MPKPIRRKTTGYRYLYGLLIGFLVLMLLINTIIPDRGFSAVENRPLVQMPGISPDTLVDGSYGQEVSSWSADQFVGRDLLFHVNYLVRKAAGQREIRDVFLGHGALLQQGELPGEGIVEAQTATITQFLQRSGLPGKVMICPSAYEIQKDKLPAGAPVHDELKTLGAIQNTLGSSFVDLKSLLDKHSQEYLFYRTDHHWTSYGAGLGTSALMESFGQSFDLDDYTESVVSGDFEGTLASRTGSVGLRDSISIFVSRDNPDYLVYGKDAEISTSIYDAQALERKDQYELFLGANQGLVRIDCLNDSRENLLIFKDSYANSMIQFLLPYYRNIYIVDPRYYNDSLDVLVESGEITQAAFLFSYNTFVSDDSLSLILNAYQGNAQEAESEASAEEIQE